MKTNDNEQTMRKDRKDSSAKKNLILIIMSTVAALATLGIFTCGVIDYMQQHIPMYEMDATLDHTIPVEYAQKYDRDNETVYQNEEVTKEEIILFKPGTVTRFEQKDDMRIPIWIKVIFANTGRKLISIEFIKAWNLIKKETNDVYIIDRFWGIYTSNNEKVTPPFVIQPGHQHIYFLKIAFPVSDKEYGIAQEILSKKSISTISLIGALSTGKSDPEKRIKTDYETYEQRRFTVDNLIELNSYIKRHVEIHAKIVGEKQIIVRNIPIAIQIVK